MPKERGSKPLLVRRVMPWLMVCRQANGRTFEFSHSGGCLGCSCSDGAKCLLGISARRACSAAKDKNSNIIESYVITQNRLQKLHTTDHDISLVLLLVSVKRIISTSEMLACHMAGGSRRATMTGASSYYDCYVHTCTNFNVSFVVGGSFFFGFIHPSQLVETPQPQLVSYIEASPIYRV